MSAIRLSISLLKTSTFSIQDCENTFYMSAIRGLQRKYSNLSRKVQNKRALFLK